MGDDSLPEIFGYNIHTDDSLASDDLFSILEALETTSELPPLTPIDCTPKVSELDDTGRLVSQNSVSSSTTGKDSENEQEASPAPTCKKRKLPGSAMYSSDEVEVLGSDGQQKSTAHVAVERNRRKQMNENLSVLRSLMPCFYVKRGDQASIIGGVVDYIKEMQQVLQSLEAKKQRKLYSEILSPRLSIISGSPKSSPILSPRKPPLGLRVLSLPTSPKTPQQTSPYRPIVQQTSFLSAQSMSGITTSYGHQPSSSSSSPSLPENATELVANSKSPIADIEVKFSGPNVLLKTISARIPGQATKIIAAVEALSLDILHMSISTIGSTMINSFTIKIGIDCKLSAEELAHDIQQTFC